MELGNREGDGRLGGMPDDPLYQHHRQPHYHHQGHATPPDPHAYHDADYPPQYRPSSDYHSSHLDTPAATSRPAVQPSLASPHTRSYADANANAVATNGLNADAVDPDDFYRSYNGVDPTSQGYDAFMATTASTSRGSPSSSLTPSHPSRPNLTATKSRTLLRPGIRSASAPINNDRPPVTMPKADPANKPSVRDLRKKFDQDTSSMIPRPPARSSLIHRPTHSSKARSATSPSRPGQPTTQTPSRSAAGSNAATPSSSRAGSSTTQHSKSTSNPQQARGGASFANRINKPKTSTEAGRSSSTPRSTLRRPSINKAPSEPTPSPSNTPSSPPSQPMLFGEILPDQRDTHALGYGIENTLVGHGSDSREIASSPTRDVRVDPASTVPDSPSDWYRIENQPDDESEATSPSTPTPRHQDDEQTQPQLPSQHRTSLPRPTQNSRPGSAQSRRPGSARRFRSGTGESPPSSGLPSPAPRGSRANGRSSRAGTPSGRRSKTPTGAGSGRKGPPQHITTSGPASANANNNRLNAFISAPPPKLSPPLRSSRPRQPVSVASTASSRLKSVDHSPGSPTGATWRFPSNTDEKPTRKKKVSVGNNIDFEERRQHVKLAYRKSIRQSRIQDAKEAKEREAKREAEAEAAQAKCDPTSNPEQPPIVLDTPETNAPPPNAETETATTPEPVPIEHDPTVPSPNETVVDRPSPTLGIPGSFPMASPSLQPDENIPQSAISTKSDVTEFDNEPQEDMDPQTPSATASRGDENLQLPREHDLTAGARSDQEHARSVKSATETTPKHTHIFTDANSETLAHTPDQLVVEIGLDLGKTPSEKADTPRADYVDPSIPGAFKEEQDAIPYIPDAFESRVRILRRESDASQHSYSPFPEYALDDSEYAPGLDTGDRASSMHQVDGDDTLTDACVDTANEVYVHDDTYYSPDTYLRGGQDNLSSHRASTCESLDANHPDGGVGALEVQQPTGSSHMLGVPTMLSSGNRSSQHSSWTDFSIDSSEPSDGFKARSSAPRPDPSPLLKQVEMYPEANPVAEENPPTDDKQLRDSADVDAIEGEEARLQSNLGTHHLPEVDTGGGFSVTYLSEQHLEQDQPVHVPRPSHEPPPIPTAPPGKDGEQHHTPSSSTYGQQSSTWVDSERPSEEYTLETSAASSILQGSLNVAEPAQDDKLSSGVTEEPDVTAEIEKSEPSIKEKQRLIQRRNVVKELIDTEAVFVRDMNIVEEIYKGTAEACPKLDGNTVKLIFRNTDEIINFHSSFLAQLKAAVAPIYQMAGRGSTTHLVSEDSRASAVTTESSGSNPATVEPDDEKDRLTSIGPVFKANLETMKSIHEGFLRSSDHAAKRLIQIQEDRTVKVWLTECNEVAMDLTAAWDLDSLLIKPMQRITKYPNIVISLLQHTPEGHPDRPALLEAKDSIETAIIEINKTKKNFELVGQIVGRKRKESDVKAGFARAFGKRVDKLQTSNSRAPDDAEYGKLRERFNDDYLRLQVVLRDVEFYTRQVTAYVHEFLQYLSSIELVMRLQSSPYPEVESKWVQFNVSMRDIQKIALEQHLSQVRKNVIEPFELVIKAYGNPSLAMKKRAKRRLDFERAEQLKKGGKSVDSKLKELVEQYEALNDTLKKELPKLSELTVKIGNISMGNFVNLQADWYGMWKDKVKVVLQDVHQTPEIPDIVSAFKRDYQFAQDAMSLIGIANPAHKGRGSHSKSTSIDDSSSMTKVKTRPAELSLRSRGPSVTDDGPPSLPTPDFTGRNSEHLSLSPVSMSVPSPHQYYYRDYYSGFSNNGYRSGGGVSPMGLDSSPSPRTHPPASMATQQRPTTGRSMESGGVPRQSAESSVTRWRDSNVTTHNTSYAAPEPPRRFSGLFHSALPMPDEAEESQRSSRASSRERAPANSGYNILWLAASLFEFNIETTKHEAGYPYLIYQAGEIFDVIAEKGELWLAKNQDDPRERVGWIWSKHFAKLADS